MEIEQIEIIDYIKSCPPLDKLSTDALHIVAKSLKIEYARRGEIILKSGQTNETVYLLRTGAVEVLDSDGKLYSHFDGGDWFGYRSAFVTGEVTMPIRAIEDCLLYEIPAKTLLDIAVEFPQIKAFFDRKKRSRLKIALREVHDTTANILFTKSASELVEDKQHILKLDLNTSIQNVAIQMTENSVTSCLIMDEDKLSGIVSDRTFCTKVVSSAVDIKQPIKSVMTTSLITIDKNTRASDALLLMTKHNIHRLPIVDENQKVLSIITVNDLIRAQSYNTIYLVNEINRANSVDELAKLALQIPPTFASMVRNRMTAYDIGSAISSIGRDINRRLLILAEKEFGISEVDYAWVVAGSQARGEQTAFSDQDNLIILDNNYDDEKHSEYFKKISKFVCDGLNECGYVYCPGDVMATNPLWCVSLDVWKGYFDKWIHTPEPKALMLSSIFFDLDFIYGNQDLLDDLKQSIGKKIKGNSIFLSHMAANALHYHPPLGIFRSFVLEKHGTESKALNMKKRGVTPITDLARVYALSAGITDTINTIDRLKLSSKAKTLSKKGKKDLLESYDFISTIRLNQQLKQVEAKQTINNYVEPDTLSSLERKHLKDAFEIVRTMQSAMSSAYHTERLV
ncbi:MAG: cyclic nucleotide-binding/CBS domain-containing protein [Gammaproteobacteria bacterium]|nr:MAG: cyclic nucleotide-binding/CBS domain-containing protein [Gammaproteobacteria bacterium]